MKVTRLCPTLCDPMDCPWNSPGQNTGVGSHSLHQGIFPTHGIEPRSPTLQADSLPAEPPGKPYVTYDYLYSRQRIEKRLWLCKKSPEPKSRASLEVKVRGLWCDGICLSVLVLPPWNAGTATVLHLILTAHPHFCYEKWVFIKLSTLLLILILESCFWKMLVKSESLV